NETGPVLSTPRDPPVCLTVLARSIVGLISAPLYPQPLSTGKGQRMTSVNRNKTVVAHSVNPHAPLHEVETNRALA
ncbi:hypothetical protein, partial [Vibrio vulnificus]|uniref:hypothetical protein n=1 Tax=Vibrio vulnificus TaxID=672 RepID=UPI0039B4581D